MGVAEGDEVGSGVDDGDGVNVGVPVGVDVFDGIGEGSTVKAGRLGSRISCCGIVGVIVDVATADASTAAKPVAGVGLASVKPQAVCSNRTSVVSVSVFENSSRPFSTATRPPDLAGLHHPVDVTDPSVVQRRLGHLSSMRMV